MISSNSSIKGSQRVKNTAYRAGKKEEHVLFFVIYKYIYIYILS